MKVDPNAPAYPSRWLGQTGEWHFTHGLPARLEIAARVLAGIAACPNSIEEPWKYAKDALDAADALIAAYNEGEKA